MKNYLLSTLIGVCLASSAHGQVFVPDTNVRAALNGLLPGLIDQAGIMDTLHPGINGLTVANLQLLNLSTSVDLQGIQYLDSLKALTVVASAPFSQPAHITASLLPLNLDRLAMDGRGGDLIVGDLPDTMTYLYFSGDDECDLIVADMPDQLDTLFLWNVFSQQWSGAGHADWMNVNGLSLPLNTLFHPPAIDVGYLYIYDYLFPLVDLSNTSAETLHMDVFSIAGILWPQGCTLINFGTSNVGVGFCLPWFPEGLTTIFLPSNIYCIPNWPSSLVYMSIAGSTYDETTAVYCSILNSDCPSTQAGLGGRAVLDVNGNNACDPVEHALPQFAVLVNPGGHVIGCQPDGWWATGVLPGDYAITMSTSHPYVQSVVPTQLNAMLASSGSVDTTSCFAITLLPDIQDLRVYGWSTPTRPGFDNRLHITCRNDGTVPMDAQITLVHDASQTWVGSSDPPSVYTGNTATWDLTGMAIGEARTIEVDLNTPASIQLGAIMQHSINAAPSGNDETPSNNLVNLEEVVVGSYDPNDKLLFPASMSPNDVLTGARRITYTVRFQNTGTYAAERVVILDTLPAGLLSETVVFENSSHAHHWYVNNGVLHVIHDNIMLPDSTSDALGSQGFFRFSVLPQSGLQDGEHVENIAHIVFDFNAPIITPPAVFSVDVLASVLESADPVWQIVPNPAQDEMRLITSSGTAFNTRYELRDMPGRTIRTGRTTGNGTIALEFIPRGAYLLGVEHQGQLHWLRFVKE